MTGRSPSTTVTLDVTMQQVTADGDDVPVRAALRYDVADPYAVHATFFAASGPPVTWVFARELLTNGVLGAAGQGDVRVWRSSQPDAPHVYLGLISTDGEALLQVSSAALATFLRRTYAQCWPGEEHTYLDTDLAIENLLAS
jgi:hypothetical protein